MDYKCVPCNINVFRQSATQGQISFSGTLIDKGIDPTTHYKTVIRPVLVAHDALVGLIPLPNEKCTVEIMQGTINATINFGPVVIK